MGGKAKRDLASILTLLRQGHIFVDGLGPVWYEADKLSGQGYKVATIYPPALESANSKWFKNMYQALREARRNGR